MSRAFTMVNTQIQELKEADSDLSDSQDEYESSYFQTAEINFDKSDFQFSQLDKEFETCVASLFGQTAIHKVGIKIKLD